MSSGDIDTSILVVSYNTKAETLACLASVYAQAQDDRFEVIVVENASSDGSAQAIAAAFPQVRLIEPHANLGFAAANNLAAREARGAYLLLLNPDTVILDHAIDRIVRFARTRPAARVYGGRTFFEDRTLNASSCHGQPTPWSVFCMGVGLSACFRNSRWFNPEQLGRWKRDTVRSVDCITGCFLLIERSLWDELEGFDTDFFMYGEDTDLCIRARKRGADCLVCPDASLIHYGGRSERVRADKMIRLFRAKRQLFQKHWPRHWVAFGVAMLQLWAGTRTVGQTARRRLLRARPTGESTWLEIWRRRQEFSR